MKRCAIEKLLLLGDKTESAKLVAIVRHKAVEFAKHVTPGAVLSKRLVFRNGWALIQVREGRRRLTIYTEQVGVEYEFFTSEGIYGRLLASPPYDSGSIYGTFVAGRGSTHVWSGTTPRSRPLVELYGTAPPPPVVDEGPPIIYKWPYFQAHEIAAEELMRTHYAWQNQRSFEYVWWPGNSGKQFVTSAAGAVPGYSSVGRLSRGNFSVGYGALNFIEDIGWDLRPSLYDSRSSAALAHGAPELDPPDWWRRACVQTVEGTAYFVMTDANGGFHFWPAGLYEDTIVPPTMVKSVTPAYPAWCDDGLGLWTFNKDGTKAVCCPYKHHAPPLTKSGSTVYKDTCNGFTRVTPASAPGWYQPAYEDQPGLVEVAIGIAIDEITGDWYPSVDIIREEVFGAVGRYFVAADYLFADDRLPYPEDTLVVMRFDLWVPNDEDYMESGGTYYPDDLEALCRHALVIEAWDQTLLGGIGDWAELHRIITAWNVQYSFSGPSWSWDCTGDAVADYSGWNDEISPQNIGAFEYAALVSAIDLRSLSWLMIHQRRKDDYSGFHLGTSVHAYGVLVEDNLQPGCVIPDVWAVNDWKKADADKRELWSNAYHGALDTWPAIAFSTHPNGHWAISTSPFPTNDPLGWWHDIVNIRQRGADVRFTHQSLHNAAFDDDRTIQFYIDKGKDEPVGDDAPIGHFKTFGIFRDGSR